MEFTIDQLTEINPTYKSDILKATMTGKEHLLSYSRCNGCEMVYCENEWDEKILTEVYLNVIDHNKSLKKVYSIDKRLRLTHLWGNILRVLKLSGISNINGLKIIDYGSGWGDLLNTIGGYGVKVVGYDTDSIKVKHARSNSNDIVNNINELKAFGKVDVIILKSVLEHIQDVNEVLTICNDILKTGGLLVIEVMDYRSRYLDLSKKKLSRGLPATTKNLNPIEHVNVFSYNSIMNYIKSFNYTVFATDLSLRFTNLPGIKNKIIMITITNWIEKLISKLVKGKELGITVFAIKK